MRHVGLAALLLLTAACGAYQFPGASPAATGTVAGRVTVMPCGPSLPQPDRSGQPQESYPCKMAPAATVELVFTSGDKSTSVLTGADGSYRVELPEGTYTVSTKKIMRIISGPPVVTVKAGSTVTADYVIDSGMRRVPAPAPQQ